jgi:hypothetical protein
MGRYTTALSDQEWPSRQISAIAAIRPRLLAHHVMVAKASAGYAQAHKSQEPDLPSNLLQLVHDESLPVTEQRSCA